MRDVVLTAFVIGLVPFILANPFIGALAWAWIGMMNPHKLTWGFAYHMPFAMIVAIPTLIGFLFTRNKSSFPWSTATVYMVLFYVWTCVTSLVGLGFPTDVYAMWLKFTKVMLMLFVTMMLIRGRRQIDLLVWVIVISIGYYGTKGGVFTIRSGGGERVWGPDGSTIAGNNEIGLAAIIVVPLMFYLAQTIGSSDLIRKKYHQLVRVLLWISMGLSAVATLGTHSRGAFLGIAGMAFFLGMKSNKKVLSVIAIVAILGGSLAFMPDKWWDRMATIQTYEDDGSAQGRLQAWGMAFNLAVDRPLVGGGHDFLSDESVWHRYQTIGLPRAAHSIYFQVLGEHGFVGLALYVLIGLSGWVMATRLARKAKGHPDFEWIPPLMRMIQVALIGFAIGGAFLSLANWDVPYYLIAIVVLAEATFRQAQTGVDTQRQGPVASGPRWQHARDKRAPAMLR